MPTIRSNLAALSALTVALVLSNANLSLANNKADDNDPEQYQTSVIASNLKEPTGIAVDKHGDVYFTQLPTPGVPGSMGGMNTVSVLDADSGQVSNITMGEPEPTHIVVTKKGDLFWTCKSAGVILKNVNGVTSLVRSGLAKPTGIAVQDKDPNRGDIYFTQLPTPGIPGTMGGNNTVSVLRNGVVSTLTLGEPEPTDIAVDNRGNLYWTCKSANVILRRNAATGQVSLLLSGLYKPSGIALDKQGNLYFTEVPTPGVPGSMGGQNKVWKYDLSENKLSLIDAGDPQPTDVAVSDDGRKVYWTCTSAGVIVLAQESDDD